MAQDTSDWPRPTPIFSRSLIIVTFQDANDIRRMREAIRLGVKLLESDAYRDVVESRISPTDDDLATDENLDRWTPADRGNRPSRVRNL